VDERPKQTATYDGSGLDPALREQARRWFAEAREQTKRDDEEIAAWHRRRSDREDGIGGPYFTEPKGD